MLKAFWQNYKLLSAPKISEPILSDIAGSDAEERFANELAKIKGINIYKNRRIKDGGAGLHEIDFIVVDGYKIYLIELKNWSGTVSENENGEWVQTGKFRTISHQNPLQKLLKNSEFFSSFLEKNGVDLDSYEIIPLVIFMHSRLKINIADKSRLKNEREFIHMLHHKRPKNRKNDPELCELLSSLTVWTRLHLYGGRILTGSVRYFIINNKKVRLPKHFRANCDLKWNRHPMICFIGSLFGKRKKLKIKSKIFKVRPNDCVVFLSAGKTRTEVVQFGLIERFVKSGD